MGGDGIYCADGTDAYLRIMSKIDQPGADELHYAPSNYIIVNDDVDHGLRGNSFLILFDWEQFHTLILSNNKNLEEQFKKAVWGALDKIYPGAYQGGSGYGALLNKAINESITNFTVTLRTTLGGNSCTFTVENINYQWIVTNLDNYFYGQSIFQEGLRFTIDARGRIDTDNLYRIWTGYITGTNEVDNPTEKNISISSSDASRWLSYTRYNVHPAVFEANLASIPKGYTTYSNVLAGKPGDEIVRLMTDLNPKNLVEKELRKLEDLTVQWTEALPDDVDDNNGDIKDDYNYNYHIVIPVASANDYSFRANIYPKRLIWGNTGVVYQQLFKFSNLYNSEWKTRKDIITDTANLTHYLSYIDGAGNIHYHPAKYNEKVYLQVKNGTDLTSKNLEHPYTHFLAPDEVSQQSYSQNEQEIVTVAIGNAQGHFGIIEKTGEKLPNSYTATIVWPDGIRRFGYREATIDTASTTDNFVLDVYTAAFLLKRNQERFQMSATIPLRPELQIDRPIWDYGKRKFYQIRQVTHTYISGSVNSGGQWQTSIDCFAGRREGEDISGNVFAIAHKYKNVKEMLADLRTKSIISLDLEDLRSTGVKELTNRNSEDKTKEVATTATQNSNVRKGNDYVR